MTAASHQENVVGVPLPWARDERRAIFSPPVRSRNIRANIADGALSITWVTRLPSCQDEVKNAYPVSDPFGTPVTKVGLQRGEKLAAWSIEWLRTS